MHACIAEKTRGSVTERPGHYSKQSLTEITRFQLLIENDDGVSMVVVQKRQNPHQAGEGQSDAGKTE